MLIVIRSRPTSVFVPATFVLLMGSMLVVSIAGLVSTPSVGAAFGLLIALGLFALVVSMAAVGRQRGTRLCSSSLFERAEVTADRAWIGFTIEVGSKGSVEYVVVADDGRTRARLATTWTRVGADRSVRRLRETFGIVDDPARDAGRRRLEDQVAAHERSQEAARAYLRAQYARPSTWITVAVVIGIFVLAYGIVMAFVMTGRG